MDSGTTEVVKDERAVNIKHDAQGNIIITGDGNLVVYQQSVPASEVEPRPEPDYIPNPYRGLGAFTEKDADRFFGREALIDRLHDRLCMLYQPIPGKLKPARVLPIIGPSGCGKSSLARAGLIPEIARNPLPGYNSSRVVLLKPGQSPVRALATVLARIATKDDTPVAKTREFDLELQQRNAKGERDGLLRVIESFPDSNDVPTFIFIDQFEELFTLCVDAEQRACFISNLLFSADAQGGNVSIVLTIRSDFLAQIQSYHQLNQIISSNSMIVPAMDKDELRRAIVQPVKVAAPGREFDSGTVELLINECEGREGSLPLLQFALTRIWEGLNEGHLAADTLKKIGGVGGALAQEAHRLYQALGKNEQEIARRAFLSLVRLGEGTQDTRRRVLLNDVIGVSEQKQSVHEVLNYFSQAGARLITLDATQGTQPTVEITHEALIKHWDDFRQWLNEDRDDLRFLRRLEVVVSNWQSQGRPSGSLWRSPNLDTLQQYYNDREKRKLLGTAQAEFYLASKQLQRRSHGIRTTILSVVVLLVIFGVSMLFVNKQKSGLVKAGELASQAMFSLGSDPTLSFRLAEASLALQRNPPGVQAFLNAYGKPYYSILDGHKGDILSVMYSSDGKTLVTASDDKTVQVWPVHNQYMLDAINRRNNSSLPVWQLTAELRQRYGIE